MSAYLHATPAGRRIIIHHLSDLHFHQGDRKGRPDSLVKYRGYLEKLAPERQPHLIVITGDLTDTGGVHDLKAIAEILRHDFARWATELACHIVVLPGPRDVTWDGSDAPSLDTFYQTFADFALPSAAHAVPQHAMSPMAELNCVVYPIDTCYALADFREDLNGDFHNYGDAYSDFVRRCRVVTRASLAPCGIGKHRRKQARAELRRRYLGLTEGNQLTLPDAGRISADDLSSFRSWLANSKPDAGAVGAAGDPLKILITHHPLALQPDATGATSVAPEQQPFKDLTTLAREAGFHLALHGHIHKSQVVSDLSILQSANNRHPMRQVGAGSLGDDGTFNEITALYPENVGERQWRLEIRTINVLADKPDEASSLVLLDPPEAAAEQAKRLERDAATRREFERRVEEVMRQFSEAVYRAQSEDRSDKKNDPLPPIPLTELERVIQHVVFNGFDVRVRLLLKDNETNRLIPKLAATYLVSPSSEGLGSLTYPATIAAWSLVLGRTLTYPYTGTDELTPDDYDWLSRSGKVPNLLKALEALLNQAHAMSFPSGAAAARYQVLYDKLKNMGAPFLSITDIYQGPPKRNTPPTYPNFICVPFPLRPTAGSIPAIPEIAVLDIGVRPVEKPGVPAKEPAEIFTDERVRMLKSISELIGVILTTSSALGKPKGVWEERFRI